MWSGGCKFSLGFQQSFHSPGEEAVFQSVHAPMTLPEGRMSKRHCPGYVQYNSFQDISTAEPVESHVVSYSQVATKEKGVVREQKPQEREKCK